MKKTTRIILTLIAGIAIGTNAIAQETTQKVDEFKPSGKPIILIFANVNEKFSDGKNLTSFEINRGFFGYDYSFSKEFSARIIYEASAMKSDGKTYMDGYLRNAYLQYAKGRFTIKGGLLGPEQLTIWEKEWNYRFVTRPFIESSGMIFAGDIGAAMKYALSEKAALDVSVTNGRGLKDLSADSTFRYSAGITLFPLKEIIFRGYTDIMRKHDVSQWTMSLSAAYAGKHFSLGTEYYSQKNHSYISGQDYTGLNFFGTVKLGERTNLYGAYDKLFSETLAGETEAWNIEKDASTLILGVDFNPVKGVRLSPNFKFINPASGDPTTTVFGIYIEARL